MTVGRVTAAYDALVDRGVCRDDPAQRAVLEVFDHLENALFSHPSPSFLRTVLHVTGLKPSPLHPLGIYLQGDVGRGKTFLMDLFFTQARLPLKKRFHFHAFMQTLHRDLLGLRKTRAQEPIVRWVETFSTQCRLLCLDEFQVTDIADAMVLGRLFKAFFQFKVVVATTSNVLPCDLYKNGLNRRAFLPFISFLEHHARVLTLSSEKDYRQDLPLEEGGYFLSGAAGQREAFQAVFEKCTGRPKGALRVLSVGGRSVTLEDTWGEVARVSFDFLCRSPLGSGDYLAIANTFSTLFIENIPILYAEERNAAKRFTLAIDTLYDHGVRVIFLAQALPEQIYAQGFETLESARTRSRLEEMRSRPYLERASAQNHF